MKYIIVAKDLCGSFTIKCQNFDEALEEAKVLSSKPNTTVITITLAEF